MVDIEKIRGMKHNVRGGLVAPAPGVYQRQSPTCYSDDVCAGAWADGLLGWHVDALSFAACRWRKSVAGHGEKVERPEQDFYSEPIVMSEYAAKKLATAAKQEEEGDEP